LTWTARKKVKPKKKTGHTGQVEQRGTRPPAGRAAPRPRGGGAAAVRWLAGAGSSGRLRIAAADHTGVVIGASKQGGKQKAARQFTSPARFCNRLVVACFLARSQGGQFTYAAVLNLGTCRASSNLLLRLLVGKVNTGTDLIALAAWLRKNSLCVFEIGALRHFS
jgi:hypothetical protein